MIVDMYFACWNDADMLGFFFRHYDGLIRRYIAFDDGSTDGSLELLRAHPRVEIRRLPQVNQDESRSIATLSPAETCWRETSADADWVMIGDIDEHLHHRDLAGYLRRCASEGITIIPALGYQMISDHLPSGGLLVEQIRTGAPWANMSKMNVFAPYAIEALNFLPGRHRASPVGTIAAPDEDELLLLHYKYLDFERVWRRHQLGGPRMTPVDKQRGLAHRWRFSREELSADWAHFQRRAIDVFQDPEPWRRHAEPRWWEPYRKSARAAG